MVVILFGWLYVVGMFAVAQTSWRGAMAVLVLLGALPVALLGRVLRQRRKSRRARAGNGGRA